MATVATLGRSAAFGFVVAAVVRGTDLGAAWDLAVGVRVATGATIFRGVQSFSALSAISILPFRSAMIFASSQRPSAAALATSAIQALLLAGLAVVGAAGFLN